jgi:hypothetical protein
MNNKHHEMVLEKTHISGVEEWFCPDCGRRFLVQWPPSYKMVVLEQGEKDTRHNVSRTNTRIISDAIQQTDEPEPIEEFRLMPWIQWMDKVDFASRWNQIQ